jgi:hypothetical protein
MRYNTLATDYDGTIAEAGRVDSVTLDTLREARAAGLRLVLVTGRELHDLFRNFSHCDIFERIVAENGALLHDPATLITRELAPPPPPALLEALARLKIPVSVGHSIISAHEMYKHAVLEVLSQLGLEWHIILNKESLMVLPSEVTKASGLKVALKELGICPEEVIGIGDAENDQAFLRLCGFSVAVANALPAVKATADSVMDHPGGSGVTDLLRRWLAGDVAPAREGAVQ